MGASAAKGICGPIAEWGRRPARHTAEVFNAINHFSHFPGFWLAADVREEQYNPWCRRIELGIRLAVPIDVHRT